MNNRFMSRFTLAAVCFMSAAGNENASGGGADVSPEKDETPVEELVARYKKKGKVVALASDDQNAFLEFTDLIGKPNYIDWSEGLDPNVFTGFALVRTEGEANRLIPLATEEAALGTGGDPAVRARAYKMYINTVVNAAEDNDAVQSQFITVGGCFKQKFDLEAFNFQAKQFVKLLRESNLRGITKKSLQLSFQSAAFAKSQFPKVTEDMWNIFLGMAEKNAASHGYNTSLFEHWKATRAVATETSGDLHLDMAAFAKQILGDDATEENATA